ncbi:MAG: hypothetical protein AAFP70_10485 [Calditrichota bacterium]
MQYGQSGKKINKQEYYCTRCKRKLPYKICPLHGMESVIMLDAASQPTGMGTSGSNGSAPNKGGKSPRPLPSGTGFEQPVKQPPAPAPAARPAQPAPPARPAARPTQPARPVPARPQPAPASQARPTPSPVATRPAQPAPPARPAPPRQQPVAPPARPQARAATITPPRPAQPAPSRPTSPRPVPPRQQPPVQQTMQQPIAPPKPAPPKPQPPKSAPPKPQPPRPQSSSEGSMFFEMEESGGNLFEFDDAPASSLENLIEQNLHTQKPPRNPLEESTQESTAMDMGFDNESLSFDPPSTGFQQEGTSHSFDPMAADPGIHRPSGNGYHDPEPILSSNGGPARDASPSRANVKRSKKRRNQAKARRTGLPISAKLALITLIPTVLVAAAVYLSFDKISEMSDSLMARINGQQSAQQTANIPPVIPQEVIEEPRNVAVSQTEETPVEETTTALSSGGSLSDRDSIEDLMVSAHQSFDKQQYLRPINNNAILYLGKVLELQEDHRPAIEMKSKIIEYYNDKAAIAIESSKYDLAIRNYENILQITPEDAITKRLLGQAQNLKRSSRKLQNMKALQKTQDEVKRLQKEKYKLKTQVKAERRKLEQINQAGGN